MALAYNYNARSTSNYQQARRDADTNNDGLTTAAELQQYVAQGRPYQITPQAFMVIGNDVYDAGVDMLNHFSQFSTNQTPFPSFAPAGITDNDITAIAQNDGNPEDVSQYDVSIGNNQNQPPPLPVVPPTNQWSQLQQLLQQFVQLLTQFLGQHQNSYTPWQTKPPTQSPFPWI